jgi:hypothetical protein
MDKDHKLIKSFSTETKDNVQQTYLRKLEVTKGMNQFVWNFQYPDAERIEGMIIWTGLPNAIIARAGKYFANFKIDKDSTEVPFTIKADPNL